MKSKTKLFILITLFVAMGFLSIIWSFKPKNQTNKINAYITNSDQHKTDNSNNLPINQKFFVKNPEQSTSKQTERLPDFYNQEINSREQLETLTKNVEDYLKNKDPEGYRKLNEIRKRNLTKRNKLGIYSEKERAYQDYNQYDTDILEKLAETGDLLAVAVLSNRYGEDGNYDKTISINTTGIIHGSVGSVHFASYQDNEKFIQQELNSTTKPYLFESMAWRLVAMMYGDNNTEPLFLNMLKGKPVLTSSEWTHVRSLAENKYSDINKERVEIGLAPLNHPDKYKFVDTFEAKLRASGYIL